MKHLILIITILLASAICSCHTQKQTSLSETMNATETVAGQSTSVTNTSVITASDLAVMLGSVSAEFSADSIRMGDVIIYAPRLAGAVASADFLAKSNTRAEQNDSAAQSVTSDAAVATNSQSATDSKSVAIADTGGSFSWGLARGAGLILLLLFVWYRKFHT